MTTEVINFGSINIDHIYQVPHFVQPGETLASSNLTTVLGGKGANQSVALARSGTNVKHVGCISKRDDWAIEVLAEAGVGVGYISQLDQPSGHAIIQVDTAGENSIILHGGANRANQLDQLERAISDCPDAEYLLLQNECNLLSEAIKLGSKSGLKLVLNPAPMTQSIRKLPIDKLDTLIVNLGEARALVSGDNLDEITREFSAFVDTRIVITLGGDGALLINNRNTLRATSPSVKVVDTTGAGDTFVGYFVAGLIHGLDDELALQRACRAASIAVTRLGAIPSIPAIRELD